MVVRFPVQVLDDSSEKEVQQLIRDEVDAWMVRGAPIVYHARQDICTSLLAPFKTCSRLPMYKSERPDPSTGPAS